MALFVAALSTNQIRSIAIAAALVWVGLAIAVAAYGYSRGYPAFPLFLASLFPVVGWATVLFVVTMVAGPTQDTVRSAIA